MQDWDEVEKDRDGCFRKHLEIVKRLHIKLSHDEIRALCEIWGCANPGDFWSRLNSTTDPALFADCLKAIERAKLRKNKVRKEIVAYA